MDRTVAWWRLHPRDWQCAKVFLVRLKKKRKKQIQWVGFWHSTRPFNCHFISSAMRDDFSHLDSTPKCSITNVNVIVTTTWAGTGLWHWEKWRHTFTLSALSGQKCSRQLRGKPSKKPPPATTKTIIEPGPVYLSRRHYSKLFRERSSKCKSGNILWKHTYRRKDEDISNKRRTNAAEQSPTWNVTRERRLVGKVKQLHVLYFLVTFREMGNMQTQGIKEEECECVCVGGG